MNGVQLHLALTHVPVILCLSGLVMLIVALLMKNATLTKTSYVILAIAAITVLPVYFSGEEAEEAVEHIPGISEALIEEHEEIAKISMISIVVSGVFALFSLIVVKQLVITRYLKMMVLLSTIVSAGLMVKTAHTGGQIRHPEMNGNAVAQNDTGKNAGDNPGGKEDDDD